MRVSVVLPTNRPEGPLYAIHGLSKQTFPQEDFELIIVDDYPDDRSDVVERVSSLLGLENVSVLRSKENYWRSNRLIGNARNTALIHVRGELVVFLDDYCWVRPRWLEEHWKTYEKRPYTMVGAIQAVKYVPHRFDNLDELPPSDPDEDYWDERERLRDWDSPEQRKRAKEVKHLGVTDSRGKKAKRNCGGGWFYTCNASAPLEKIIEVGGFDEEFDTCSEEDIDLGLRLERVGCKFWYRPDPDCTVYHMDHREVDREMKKWPKRYVKVTYEELRHRGAVESNPDEVQLVLKEKYGTRFDGSWGLHERNYGSRGPVNVVNGKRIFDLRGERRKLRNA